MFSTVHSTAQEDKSNTPPIEISYSEKEFLKGEGLGEWIVVFEHSEFNGVGMWPDGSFFVHLGEKINIYSASGEFSNCLNCHSFRGGTMRVRAINEDDIQLLLYRDNCAVSIDKQGNVLELSYLEENEFEQLKTLFLDVEKKWFSVNSLTLNNESHELTVKIPPRISLPFLSSTHITVSNQTNLAENIIFDDKGIVFFRGFLTLVLVFAVLIGAYVIASLIRRKKRKENIDSQTD